MDALTFNAFAKDGELKVKQKPQQQTQQDPQQDPVISSYRHAHHFNASHCLALPRLTRPGWLQSVLTHRIASHRL